MESVGKRSKRVDYAQSESESESDCYDSHQSDSEEESSDDLTLMQYQERCSREVIQDPLDKLQLDDVPEAKQPVSVRGCDDWVGRRVRRSFPGHGYFNGVITKIKRGTGRARWFHTIYEDGDAEDLSAKEITESIQPINVKADAAMMKNVVKRTQV